MMYRVAALHLPALLVSLLALGCGSSSSTPTDAGPLPVDQCINANDLAIAQALAGQWDGGLPDGGVPDGGPYPTSFMAVLRVDFEDCARNTCMANILTDNDADQCMADCLSTTGAAGLTTGCVACENEIIRCGAANCLNVCLGDNYDLCIACGHQYCTPRMVECTGLPQDIP